MRLVRWATLLVMVSACGPQLVCGEGASELDGACVAEEFTPDDPVFSEILASLYPCEGGAPGTGMDLEALCIGDICVGDSFDALQPHILGGCRTGRAGLSECGSSQAQLLFPDGDQDGQPDAGATLVLIDVSDHTARDPHGVALGDSLSCFVDALPTPDVVSGSLQEDGSWVLREAIWAGRVRVADQMTFGAADVRFDPDGRSDELDLGSLFGG